MLNKWMYETGHHFHKTDRVRLRAAVDPAIYGDFACVGNIGTIQDRRQDRWGLPEVYIEWDKNHWAYNGVGDCWTFEEHFEKVEDGMASKKDKKDRLLALLADVLDDDESDSPPDETPKAQLRQRFLDAANSVQAQEPSAEDLYEQAIKAAVERLAHSEAFIVIGVERHEHPRVPNGMLEPFAFGHSLTPEGDVLVAAHMSSAAARAHQDLAIHEIGRLTTNE